jgi:hypothetical protein
MLLIGTLTLGRRPAPTFGCAAPRALPVPGVAPSGVGGLALPDTVRSPRPWTTATNRARG